MQIDVTLTGPSGARDVRITAPAGTPAGAVLAELAALAGRPGAPVRCAGIVLVADRPLEEQGVRAGAVLTVGASVAPRSATLALAVVRGADAGRVVPLARGRVTLGRASDCDIVLTGDGVSRRHAQFEVTAGGVLVRDLGSTNGTRLDGVPVSAPVAAADGQSISLGDTVLTLAAPGRPQPARRDRTPASAGPVELARPQPPPRAGRGYWIGGLAPVAVGAIVAWAAHSALFLLVAILSPVAMIAGSIGDGAARRHRRALARHAAEVEAALAAETAARRSEHPGPAAVWSTATTGRVWRRRADVELLPLRVGTATLPSRAQVRDGPSTRPAGIVVAVPACVDLGAGPLAVVGPAPLRAGVARWLVGQLAGRHPPHEVEVALLLDPCTAAAWAWARWLPHLGDRVAASSAGRADLIGRLVQRASGPRLVVIVDTGDLAGDSVAELVTRGACVVWVGGGGAPAWCASRLAVDGATGERALLSAHGEAAVPVAFDQAGPAWAEEVARALAPLGGRSGDARRAPPEHCDLLDLLGVPEVDAATIATRWRNASGHAETVIGASAGGPLRLDLDADGPHALIAGTTGSGKSHLLQMLVAGLSVDHPPDALTFLLVDYKGGAAFDACTELPHTTGVVTDLDPHLTRRALASLEAELRRRERAFAAVRAPDHAAYARTGAGPIPKLVIVVDEFAGLADELPEFVRGLVSVAQRGRSLGVHLVLATQRPGTAVTPEIRANTSLRIALRMTGVAESAEVIDAPDAAAIPPGAAGRAVLRRGGETVAFQTAGLGHRENPSHVAVDVLGDWRRPPLGTAIGRGSGPAPLRALVRTIAAAPAATGRRAADRPWCPPLPDHLPASAVPRGSGSAVAIGLVDRPDRQSQPALTLDVGGGESVLVVGAARTGRTGALLVSAYAAAAATTPTELEIHALSVGPALAIGLAGLPHVGTCLDTDALDLLPVLLERVLGRPGRRALLLLDDWDVILGQDGDGATAEFLDPVLRAPPTAGITVVAAGGRSLLHPRIAATFGRTLLLRPSDRADYALAGVPAHDAPPVGAPAGRGVLGGDGAHFQLGVPDDALCAAATQHAAAPDALRLRVLPAAVSLTALPRGPGRVTLGVGGPEARVVALELHAPAPVRLLVAGPPRSGRSATLRTLLTETVRLGLAAAVAARSTSPAAAQARDLGVPTFSPGQAPAEPPPGPAVLLIDDAEEFGDDLVGWLRAETLAVVAAIRSDDLAAAHRGVIAEVRRRRHGLLLDPGPADGELLGIRTPRVARTGRPGRGLLVGLSAGPPLTIQVAAPC